MSSPTRSITRLDDKTSTGYIVYMEPTELQAWMREHGYTLVRLAGELGVTTRTVTRWRNGETPIPRTVELALAALE